MTISRVPAGVPSGGQFAASLRGEAGLGLSDQGAAGAMQRANSALTRLQDAQNELADAIESRSIVDSVTARYPDAHKIVVSHYDDGNGPDSYLEIFDADDEVIDSEIGPFRPEHLDRCENEFTGYDLYVDQVRATDIDEVAERVDRAILDSILSRRPDWKMSA